MAESDNPLSAGAIGGIIGSALGASEGGASDSATGKAGVILGTAAGDDREQAFEDFYKDPKHGPSNKPFAIATSLPPPDDKGQISRGYIRRANFNVDSSSKFTLKFMFNPENIQRDYLSYLDQSALDPFNTIYNSGNLIAPPSFINFDFNLAFDRQIQQHSKDPAKSIPEGVLHDYQYFDIVVRNVPPFTDDQPFRDNGVMMINPQEIVVYFSKDLVVRGRPTNAGVNFIKFSHSMIPTRMEIKLTLLISYFGPEAGLGSGQMEPAPPDNTYPALVPYDTYLEFPGDEAIRAASVAAQAAFSVVKNNFLSTALAFLSPLGFGLAAIFKWVTGSSGAGNEQAAETHPGLIVSGALSLPGKWNDETAIGNSYGGYGHIPMGSLMIGPFKFTVAAAAVPAFAALDAIFKKYNYPIVETGGGYVDKMIRNTNKRSMHAYGLAVDVNQTKNPRLDVNRGITDMDDKGLAMINEITTLKTTNGVTVFNWGGYWKLSQDSMHFQINAFAGDLATGINMASATP